MNSTLKYTVIAIATLALSLGAACGKDDASVTAEETTTGAETVAAAESEVTEEMLEEAAVEAEEEAEQADASDLVN